MAKIRITKVKYLIDYKLEIIIYNKETIVFDFERFLKKSTHKSNRKYLDKDKFKTVELVSGFLSWNDGEMEISGEWIWNEYYTPNDVTIRAIEASRKGKVTKTKNLADLFRKLNR